LPAIYITVSTINVTASNEDVGLSRIEVAVTTVEMTDCSEFGEELVFNFFNCIKCRGRKFDLMRLLISCPD